MTALIEIDPISIPIIIGTQSEKIIKSISETLKPYLTKDNLFIISTDFSHYPSYTDAITTDKNTAEAIISNSSKNFIRVIQKNKEKNIPKLQTSICGWSAVLALIDITEKNELYKYEIIDYKNSGDAIYGDKDGVVGYYSIVLKHQETV